VRGEFVRVEKMIGIVENRIGKIIYGVLSSYWLVLTLYTFKPDGPDMPDDLRTIGFFFLMSLLSFPVSIVAAAACLRAEFRSCRNVCFIAGMFTDIKNLSRFQLSHLFSWLGSEYSTLAICNGFGFRVGQASVLGINRKSHV
jgi:hypothetical protein